MGSIMFEVISVYDFYYRLLALQVVSIIVCDAYSPRTLIAIFCMFDSLKKG